MENRRQADYSLLNSTKNFAPTEMPESSHGIGYDFKKEDLGGYLYELVSAPMGLARLIAAYKGLNITTGGQQNYKTTWETALKLNDSNLVITFYDFKGAFSIGANQDPTDSEWVQIIELLKAIVNNQFPHPYDDCVVGEVA